MSAHVQSVRPALHHPNGRVAPALGAGSAAPRQNEGPEPDISPPASEAVVFQFETEEFSKREDLKRARHLRRTIPPDGPITWLNFKEKDWLLRQYPGAQPDVDRQAVATLAAKLEKGAETGFPSPTLASALAMRGMRIAVVGALIRFFEAGADEDLRTFTILNSNWVLTPEELNQTSARKIKRQVISHLNRAGVTALAGPFIAFLHGEFEPVSGKYVLHLHGITTKAKADALRQLLVHAGWGYVKSASGADPIKRRKLSSRVAQFSYLLKSYWPQRGIRLIDGAYKRDRKGQRLKGTFHTQLLLWLDRQTLHDITILNDVWSPRNRGSELGRQLYLAVSQSVASEPADSIGTPVVGLKQPQKPLKKRGG